MKIAMIVPAPIVPTNEGGRVRIYNLLVGLAARHEMLLLTPRDAAYSEHEIPAVVHQIARPGRRAQIISPHFMREARAILGRERPDVMLVEFPWSGLHAMYLSRRTGIPYVLDAHNVEGDRFRSTGSRAWRAVAFYERIVARVANSVFAVSESDCQRFAARGIPRTRLQLVPNGVDPLQFHRDDSARDETRGALGISSGTRLVLFFGQLDYQPNREALHIIEREILPRIEGAARDVRILIVGKRPPNLPSLFEHPAVRYAGVVPAMPRYLNAADVVIAPLRTGGGTRLKLLESIASGTPVVSTAAGAEGIAAAVGGPLLFVEDGWDEFVKRLLDDEHVKRGNVPAPFLDMYSWANIVRRIVW